MNKEKDLPIGNREHLVDEASTLLRAHDTRVQLLLADDDALMRSLLASRARETVDVTTVLEAADGAEAVQLGLRERPQIALVDVNMPKLGGIEVALTLRELQPQMLVA